MTDLQKATIQAMVNIFESGRIRGNYGAIAVMKGDKGHLSYGRSQTTLGGGGLFTLLSRYCQAPNAQFAADLKPALPRFKAKDFTLDNDSSIKSVLKQAGDDPVMQATQDQFFDENYFIPSGQAAEKTGLQTVLAYGVVYDSHIQGGWGIVQANVPPLKGAGSEHDWIGKYVDARRKWLQSQKNPLPATVYRMDAFEGILTAGNLDLTLPIIVHGITLKEDLLATGTRPDTTLKLTDPWMRGDSVERLQKKLKDVGFDNQGDGVYGPFTDALVKKFQQSKNIAEDGVGPQTKRELGL